MFFLQLSPLTLTVLLVIGVPLSAFLLRQACSICRSELPSYRRAVLAVLILFPVTWLTFDFSSYLGMRALGDPTVYVPPGYGYLDWLNEPPAVKWSALEGLSVLRFLPAVFALCAAGTVLVFALEVSFHVAAPIAVVHIGATAAALWFCAAFLGPRHRDSGVVEEPPAPAPVAGAGPSIIPDEARLRQKLTRTVPKFDDNGQEIVDPASETPPAPEAEPAAPEGEPPPAVRIRLKVSREAIPVFLETLRDQADPYLASVKRDTEPVTRRLPEPYRHFLDRGGWWLVIGLAALGTAFWVRSFAARVRTAWGTVAGTRIAARSKVTGDDRRVDLGALPPPPPATGPRRLTCKGMNARVRVIVLAPIGKDLGELRPELADTLLDWIKPGLGRVVAGDAPLVRIWGRQYTLEGFPASFFHNLVTREAKGQRSRWALVAGTVAVGKQKVHLGLALWLDRPTLLRTVTVQDAGWLDVLDIAK